VPARSTDPASEGAIGAFHQLMTSALRTASTAARPATPGDMGHDARQPVGQCGERVNLQLGGRLWWCRSRTERASGRRRRWRATLSPFTRRFEP
jgi:hypothetical protein